MTPYRLASIVTAVALSILSMGSKCGPTPSPTPPGPVPPPPAAFCVVVAATDAHAGTAVPGASVSVGSLIGTTDGNGYLDLRPVLAGPQTLRVQSAGYEPYEQPIEVESWDCGHDVALTPIISPLPRVSIRGQQFWADGKPFDWRGVTAFQLMQFVATGQPEVARRFMAWMVAHDVNVLRVMTTVRGMFALPAQDGARVLPELLRLAEQERVYLEVVALADTCPAPDPDGAPCSENDPYFDYRNHVISLGASCAASSACLGIEIANEPRHPTQAKNVSASAFLMMLRTLVPPQVLVALGAESGADDKSAAYAGADYVTVHLDRADGDHGWRWVRHAREMQVLQDKVNKPIVNDEPDRKVPFTDQHLALALLTRMYGIGDTVHLASLRYAMVPTGDELAAFEARRRGWALVPSGFLGTYSRATLPGDPVKYVDAAQVLRSYSALDGDHGFVLMIGVTRDGAETAEWNEGWARELLAREGGVRFWRVQR